MSGVLENAARLSQVIGARPAGTEEEQQASFVIEEQLQNAGLETSVEEINCNTNYELPRIVCCIVSIVLAVLAAFLPLMAIPSLIVCAIMAILYVMEVAGISPLNNMAKRGLSQNVVAKYIPRDAGISAADTGTILPIDANDEVVAGADDADIIDVNAGSEAAGRSRKSKSSGSSRGARKRKIVVLARYDSGKVCPELKQPFLKVLHIIRWVEIGGIVAIPIALLLRLLTNAEGASLVFWNIIMIAGAVVVLLPVLRYIFHQTSPYSEGANNNAAGVAVMLEVAARIAASADAAEAAAQLSSDASKNADAFAEGEGAASAPSMHGEEAILASGMLPANTDLVYEETAASSPSATGVPANVAEAERLAAEGTTIPVSMPEGFVGAVATESAAGRAAANVASAASSIEGDANSIIQTNVRNNSKSKIDDPNVPDWFKKGIEKANANKEAAGAKEEPQAQRSRFADALDAAAIASANSIQEFESREAMQVAQAAQAAGSTAGIDPERLQQVHENIMGSKTNMAAQAEVAAVAAEIAASEAEAAKAAAEAAASAALKASGKELTPEEAISQAGSTLKADVAAAIGAQQAAQAAAAAQAVEEVAEQAAVADRTISYIPVAAEIPTDLSAVEIGETSAAEAVAKSASEILEDVAAAAEGSSDPASQKEGGRKRRSISLPSLTGAINAMNEKLQDAPLGEDAEREAGEARSVALSANEGRRRRTGLDDLPSTDLPSKKSVSRDVASAAGSTSASTHSSISAKQVQGQSTATSDSVVAVASIKEGSTTSFLKATEEKDAAAALSSLDAPVVAVRPSATSQFAPVGEELIANMMEDEIIIEDVDDSDYTDNVTHTGAMAGPGYVDMPKSRAQRFRNIFGRKKKRDDSISFSEAVGLEENFDARQVGASRGSWESFQNESADYEAGATFPEEFPETAPANVDDNPRVARGKQATSRQEAGSRRQESGKRRSHVDEYSTNSRSLRFKSRDDDWSEDAWSDDWNGGAFSLGRRGSADDGHDGRRSREGSRDGVRNNRGSRNQRNQRTKGAQSGQRRRSADEISSARKRMSDGAPADALDANNAYDARDIAAADMLEEREQIRSFRTGSAPLASFEEVAAYAGAFSADLAENVGLGTAAGVPDSSQNPDDIMQPVGFQTEVWFVALGAELADNAGIKAFLNTHADEMRGAIVIDLDALGAGELSLIDEEGTIRSVKASSRMKRYVTKAGTAIGLHINSVKMRWRESAAYFAATRGLQTIHVAGFLDGKPAYQGEEDDKFDKLSEEKMLENTAFVLELLNNI